MKSTKITMKTVTAIAAGIMLASPLLAFAQGSSNSAAATDAKAARTTAAAEAKTTRTAERTAASIARDNKAIDTRISALTALASRIQQLKNVSDLQKSSITTSIQTLISNLTDLKAKIAADTSTTTLKADSEAITRSYRVYALAMPEFHILAASDRIVTVAGMLQIVGAKLATRLSLATNVPNATALQASLSDLATKTSDALSQAQAAVSEVTVLVPDNGDNTIMASNTAAIKDAQSKIQAANKDLVAARKDIETILKAVGKLPNPTTASSTPVTIPPTAAATSSASTTIR